MQLTIKAIGENSRVISYLLSKNPSNLYDRDEKGSRVRLVYTAFTEEETELLIYVTPDPVELVRNSPNTFDITQYINDREFAVSSLFCSYIKSALATALNGKPKDDFIKWVDYKFDLILGFGPVASDLPDAVIESIFTPIGYEVKIERGITDYSFKLKSRSSARYINLTGRQTLQNAIRHLFILIPVLDNYKHYYMDKSEVDKLERYGTGWLDDHPMRDLIIKRALKFKELISEVASPKKEDLLQGDSEPVEESEIKVRLNEQRYQTIVDIVTKLPQKETVVDFGSGEGKLSVRLGFIPGVKEVLAVEPSQVSQLRAIRKIDKVRSSEGFVAPTQVWGSLFYFDTRLCDKDVMILSEVIEHIDEYRLAPIIETVFAQYSPKTLIINTPNYEYNVVFEMKDNLRHSDHRFEWTREQFSLWCKELGARYNYSVNIGGIGEEDTDHGFPTQIAIFSKTGGE